MTAINRKAERALTPAMVREILVYCPIAGSLKWKVTRGTRAIAGNNAGRIEEGTGYVRVGINRHQYMAHRLAWAYMLGRWPDDLVDHENRDRSDNRWINLRPATYAQNNRNRAYQGNSSGLKGAYKKPGVKKKSSKHWSSSIQFEGKQICLGTFHTAEEASAAYAEAAKKYHGDFSSLEGTI